MGQVVIGVTLTPRLSSNWQLEFFKLGFSIYWIAVQVEINTWTSKPKLLVSQSRGAIIGRLRDFAPDVEKYKAMQNCNVWENGHKEVCKNFGKFIS